MPRVLIILQHARHRTPSAATFSLATPRIPHRLQTRGLLQLEDALSVSTWGLRWIENMGGVYQLIDWMLYIYTYWIPSINSNNILDMRGLINHPLSINSSLIHRWLTTSARGFWVVSRTPKVSYGRKPGSRYLNIVQILSCSMLQPYPSLSLALHVWFPVNLGKSGLETYWNMIVSLYCNIHVESWHPWDLRHVSRSGTPGEHAKYEQTILAWDC